MKAFGDSNVGKVRNNNEDSFYFEAGHPLLIVADGLGGHSAGEVASNMAVTYVSSQKPQNPEELANSFVEANNQVHEEAKKKRNDMATTMSAILIDNDKGYISHVGDSRIYRVRDEKISCLTDDHTPVMESLRAGLITEAQAHNHPLKHMLSRTIGTHAKVKVDSTVVDIQANDVYVLCTDGLSNLAEEDDILKIVLKEKEPEQIVGTLIKLALARGGVDNVTVVSARIEPDDIKEVAADPETPSE